MLKKLYLEGNLIPDLSGVKIHPNLEFIRVENNLLPLELKIELGYLSGYRKKIIKE